MTDGANWKYREEQTSSNLTNRTNRNHGWNDRNHWILGIETAIIWLETLADTQRRSLSQLSF